MNCPACTAAQAPEIKQGRAYKLGDAKVICLSVEPLTVGVVSESLGWFSSVTSALPNWLEPMPQKYLQGGMP